MSDRFVEATNEWADARMKTEEDAIEDKVEQALLEIEHLVSGAFDVEFTVDGHTITHEPTPELTEFLEIQSEAAGIDEATLLKLHVDLFATVFLEDAERPDNAPPK